MTQVETKPKQPEENVQPRPGKSAATPPEKQKADTADSIPDPLFNCWMALNNGHRDLEHTIEMLSGIEAIVQKHAEGSGEELVVSECEATTILYLARTNYHRLSELKDLLAKQVSVLLQLSNEKPTTGRSPEQPGDDTPAATVKLDDIRKQVKQVAALIEGAYVCEWSHEEKDGTGNDSGYFAAVSGVIAAARIEVARLVKKLAEQPAPV